MNIQNILIGTGLFSAGVVSGYFICKKALSQQYRDDLEDVQEFYYEKLKEMGVQDEDFEAEQYEEGVEDEYERTVVPTTAKGRPIVNYNKPSLEDMARKIEDDDDDDEGEIEYDPEDSDDPDYEEELEIRAEEYARRRNENESKGLPYVITHDEYLEGPREYEKLILYYYSEDRVLCEDDDRLVDGEEELVGFDYEDVLDMQTIAWVRNDAVNMLYEIHRVDQSYERDIKNLRETPREREFRIKGRRKQALDDF